MTEQQLTENQIQAATGHVVTLLARAKKTASGCGLAHEIACK